MPLGKKKMERIFFGTAAFSKDSIFSKAILSVGSTVVQTYHRPNIVGRCMLRQTSQPRHHSPSKQRKALIFHQYEHLWNLYPDQCFWEKKKKNANILSNEKIPRLSVCFSSKLLSKCLPTPLRRRPLAPNTANKTHFARHASTKN